MTYRFENSGTVTIVYITGDIDTAATTAQLDREIAAMIAGGHLHFVFNLEKTTYLDSAGISVFIHCLCGVQEKNGSIVLVAPDNQVKRVLEMVGLNRLITTYDTLHDGLVAAGGDNEKSQRPAAR
ncbi:MAG: STAS domain-containing protein [Chitinispirillaceae bacterium]|nr:STAS domain-containing protein [Chitinispirillaceae bacterium]